MYLSFRLQTKVTCSQHTNNHTTSSWPECSKKKKNQHSLHKMFQSCKKSPPGETNQTCAFILIIKGSLWQIFSFRAVCLLSLMTNIRGLKSMCDAAYNLINKCLMVNHFHFLLRTVTPHLLPLIKAHNYNNLWRIKWKKRWGAMLPTVKIRFSSDGSSMTSDPPGFLTSLPNRMGAAWPS